jgi:hypothetical protein
MHDHLDARIAPRSLTWHIVEDADMRQLCDRHGLRADCEGMAIWDDALRNCVIWTRSPRSAEDMHRWRVVHHELQHCQDGGFHASSAQRSGSPSAAA